MLFKAILAVFAGTFGMIIRYILILGLCFGLVMCVFSVFCLPFLWEGIWYLLGALVILLLLRFLIRLGRDKDEPPEDDRRDKNW